MGIAPDDQVWGSGKNAEKISRLGIKTVLQLAQMNQASARRHFSIALVKTFAARASERLRAEGQVWGAQPVSEYRGREPDEKAYSPSATAKLSPPASDTRTLGKAVTELFNALWREGYRYAKSGVMLLWIPASPITFSPACLPIPHSGSIMRDLYRLSTG